jgi:hypothetical protein
MLNRCDEGLQYQTKVSWYEVSSREFSSRTENNTLIIAMVEGEVGRLTIMKSW